MLFRKKPHKSEQPNRPAMKTYAQALQQAVSAGGLDLNALNTVLRNPDQDVNAPLSLRQSYLIDVIMTVNHYDVPISSAIEAVDKTVKKKGWGKLNIDHGDIWARAQTYYLATHLHELNTPETNRVVQIFRQECEGEFEHRSGMTFTQMPEPLQIGVVRAVRRDLKHFKNKNIAQAMDKDIREILNNPGTSVWAELNMMAR